ncbi:MAG: YitT family protein [Clostridia bacterium]|nr:YitT family protein [Clostridia bacterium]
MTKEVTMKTKLKNFALMNLGILLTTVGVYFFKIPNGFSTGGVSGIAVVVAGFASQYLPEIAQYLTSGNVLTVINVLLLIVGFIFLGKGFSIKTVYCSLLFSFGTFALEHLIPMSGPFTNQPFLELVYAILLTAIGSALLFMTESSSGGTDIVALILKKYTNLDIGKALLATDFVIALSAFWVFGMQTGLFSLLGLFAKAFLVDGVIESMNTCKYFTIVTSKPEEISRYITAGIHRGFTKIQGVGGYTGEQRTVLLTVCRRMEGVKLRKIVKQIDPGAFIIVSNSSEIIGKGFRGV